MISPHHAQAIRTTALAAYPNEAAWLLVGDDLRQVRNIAKRPAETFSIAKKDMARALADGLTAIIHSHPDSPACPSATDMQGQIDTGVPWGIVATDGQRVSDITWWGGDTPRASLEGRGFVHGVTDCYALIRDWYAAHRNVELIEVPRDWEWWRDGGNLYVDQFERAGFRHIPHAEAAAGDVWLCQIRSPVLNHGGILLERGEMLHHPMAREGGPVQADAISRREPVARWLPHISQDRGGMILRYVGATP